VAYTINGQWSVTSYKKAGIDVGVAPLPKLPNGKNAVSFLGVQALCVSAYSNYPNAAKLFAEMAASEEMLLKRYEMTHEIPPMKSIMDNEKIKSDSVASVFLQQAQYSTVMPFISQMGLVWDPYMRALQSIWDKDTDPKAALDECTDIIKKDIASQN
jgi:arabinogalactan oligomer/maltooligosaccharide transport system substrate-binding protein